MLTLLLLAALAGLAWWLSRSFAGPDPARRARWLRRAGGLALSGGALLMLARGRLDMAALLGTLAAWALAAGAPFGLGPLKAHLDRRLAGRREHAERDAHARVRGRAGNPAAMTEEQAYQVLGLAPGAGPDAVLESHRRLMKRVHPDQGGSTELAAQVNQARDVLLGRHR